MNISQVMGIWMVLFSEWLVLFSDKLVLLTMIIVLTSIPESVILGEREEHGYNMFDRRYLFIPKSRQNERNINFLNSLT